MYCTYLHTIHCNGHWRVPKDTFDCTFFNILCTFNFIFFIIEILVVYKPLILRILLRILLILWVILTILSIGPFMWVSSCWLIVKKIYFFAFFSDKSKKERCSSCYKKKIQTYTNDQIYQFLFVNISKINRVINWFCIFHCNRINCKKRSSLSNYFCAFFL